MSTELLREISPIGKYGITPNYIYPPDEGILLPTEIQIPPENLRRTELSEITSSYGLKIPSSLNRRNAIQRMVDRLISLGYERDGNILRSDQPIRLIRETQLESVHQNITLPERISAQTFSRAHNIRDFIRNHHLNEYIRISSGRLKGDLERDLRTFLTEHGYTQTSAGDYVKYGNTTIRGGFDYSELANIEAIISFLLNLSSISIRTSDLRKLNHQLSTLLQDYPQSRWSSLSQFGAELSDFWEMDPHLPQLILVLMALPKCTTLELSAIVSALKLPSTSKRKNLSDIRDFIRQKLNLIPQTYPDRELSETPAPPTLTLKEAVEQGYPFDLDQYQQDIQALLNYQTVPKEYLKIFVGLIQKYPDLYQIFQGYRPTPQNVAGKIIELYYPQAPNHVQVLYAYAINYPLILPEDEVQQQRRQQLNNLPSTYIVSLYAIYNMGDLELILDQPQHPLELYLVAISRSRVPQLKELVAGFGMFLPEHLLNRDVRSYVLTRIPEYRNIITRPENTPSIEKSVQNPNSVEHLNEMLQNYSDMEIMDFFGYIGGFENRAQLIENIYETITLEGFILFKELDLNKTTNVQTTLMSDFDEIPSPYLVFGTPFAYRVLELDELNTAFEDGSFTQIGEDPSQKYTIPQISQLQSILPSMKSVNLELSELIDQVMIKIRQGIASNLRRNALVNNFLRLIRVQDKDIQEQVQSMFMKIFFAGMYMRRWHGPGYRYPTRSSQTQGKSNPEPRSVAMLGEMYDILNSLSPDLQNILHELPEINYLRNGDVNFRIEKLFTLIRNVAIGNACIRESSRTLVVSASYYLMAVFGHVIPDFDPHDVETIA